MKWVRTVAVLVVAMVVGATVGITAQRAVAQENFAPVIIIGIPGLQWSDIDQTRTPTLWNMAQRAAVGSISVRTPGGPNGASCPAAGWFSISAGRPAHVVSSIRCRRSPTPIIHGSKAQVPDFAELRDRNKRAKFSPRLGLLGDTIHRAGGKTAAIGPGGLLGAADHTGSVDRYVGLPEELTDPARYALIMVGFDYLVPIDGVYYPLSDEEQQLALKLVDQQVNKTLAMAPRGSTVLLAGISDAIDEPQLHTALAIGPGFQHNFLTANSTHQDGLVTINDIAVTALTVQGISPPAQMIGRQWTNGGKTSDSVSELVKRLQDDDRAARANRRNPGWVWSIFYLQIGLYIIALAAFWLLNNRILLQLTRMLAVLCGALPVASIAANVAPWWRWSDTVSQAAQHQLIAISCACLLMVGIAFAGPWRAHPLGPLMAISLLTVGVISSDLIFGLGLQINSPAGYSPLGGGRYFGLGNITYTLFAVASLFVMAGAAYIFRHRRMWMIGAPAAIGMAAVLLDGLPGWGADFGGVIALGPAVLASIIVIAGWRVSILRAVLITVSGLLTVIAIAWLDSLRSPANRTHLGQFFADVLAGRDATEVIDRKFTTMMRTFVFGDRLWIVLSGLFFTLIIIYWQRNQVTQMIAKYPTLRASFIGIAIIGTVGLVVNDSGMSIPAAAISLAIPLIITVLLQVAADQRTESTVTAATQSVCHVR